MKRIALLLAAAMLLSLAACAADPAPADTSDSADSTDSTTPADTADSAAPADTEPAEEIPPYKQPVSFTTADGKYQVTVGAPSVVVQADPKIQTWGNYQFPHLSRTADGFIICSYSVTGTDTIEYTGTSGQKISVNGGKSWMLSTAYDQAAPVNLMANGKYFIGFNGKGAHKVDWLDDYTPAVTWDRSGLYKMFYLDDVKDDPEAAPDVTVTAAVYDPATKKTESFTAKINWPNAPLVQYPDKMVFPVTQVFAMSKRIVVDGIPYAFLYFNGFDSAAESRDDAMLPHYMYYSVYVFRSDDYGYTWDYVSQIDTDDTICAATSPKGRDGVAEPDVTVLPDGTWCMLVRTGGSGNPAFITYSKDKGVTWTAPAKFDAVGVLPQIVTLDCGVTVASYGRPDLRVRVTSDPAGKQWEDAVILPMASTNADTTKVGCFNTDLLVLDENSVLLAYSDFKYPNKKGELVKTILTRVITVTPVE